MIAAIGYAGVVIAGLVLCAAFAIWLYTLIAFRGNAPDPRPHLERQLDAHRAKDLDWLRERERRVSDDVTH